MDIDFKEQIATKTDQELIDIYVNQEDYQDSFVNAAVEELTKRNISPDTYQQERITQERIKQEKLINETPEKGIPGNPIYVGLAFISAFLGGLIGIIAGYIYSQSKKEGHYVYNEKTRIHGQIMMIVGIFVLIATLVWQATSAA